MACCYLPNFSIVRRNGHSLECEIFVLITAYYIKYNDQTHPDEMGIFLHIRTEQFAYDLRSKKFNILLLLINFE
jgi:hypothetical protein